MEHYLSKKETGEVALSVVKTELGDLVIATVTKIDSVVVEIKPEALQAERAQLVARIAEIDELLSDHDACIVAAKAIKGKEAVIIEEGEKIG